MSTQTDALSNLQLVVCRLFSEDLQQVSETNGGPVDTNGGPVDANGGPVDLAQEAARLAQLGSQLESDYKSGVTHPLQELEDLQTSIGNLFWQSQQHIETYGEEDPQDSMKLTDVVEKLSNIKNWVEKMEDLMKEELDETETVVSDLDGFNDDENPSTDV